jgi:uncharacterized protein (TIGR03084 family)
MTRRTEFGLGARPTTVATFCRVQVRQVLDDLVAEQHALDDVVADIPAAQWALDTPSPRWTVADQIGHLTFFDGTAALAITDAPAFLDHKNELTSSFADELAVDDATLGAFRRLSPADQLAAWRDARGQLETAARTLTDDARVEWYGPSMGSKSFLTARLMEVWAHGQDVCDTVDSTRPPTDRLRHIAQLGVITRGWSYIVRGERPPEADVRVELTAPSGEVWTWGTDDAPSRITGPADDFCLVVTQRRHVDDTTLTAEGEAAEDWMRKAQAFAGAPTQGPAARGAG